MKTQLLRIYDKFAEDDRVRILSHTIDPEYDGVRVLKEYAKKLNISSPRWNLLTGKKSDIYRLGEKAIWLLLKRMQMKWRICPQRSFHFGRSRPTCTRYL